MFAGCAVGYRLSVFFYSIPVRLLFNTMAIWEAKVVLNERKSSKGFRFDSPRVKALLAHFDDRPRQRHCGKFIVKVPQILVVINRKQIGWFNGLAFHLIPVDCFKEICLFESGNSANFKHGTPSCTKPNLHIPIQQSLEQLTCRWRGSIRHFHPFRHDFTKQILGTILGSKGRLTREHFKGNATKTPVIRRASVTFSSHHFGRHVLHRPTNSQGPRLVRFVLKASFAGKVLGETKVCHTYVSVLFLVCVWWRDYEAMQ
jgi:hypothetical protein